MVLKYLSCNQNMGMNMQISSCLKLRREREEYPFSFPLLISLVNEGLINSLDGNGLGGKCYGLEGVFEIKRYE